MENIKENMPFIYQGLKYSTCVSGQVLDSGGCNTAGRILAQHIVEMAQSPSFTELRKSP